MKPLQSRSMENKHKKMKWLKQQKSSKAEKKLASGHNFIFIRVYNQIIFTVELHQRDIKMYQN